MLRQPRRLMIAAAVRRLHAVLGRSVAHGHIQIVCGSGRSVRLASADTRPEDAGLHMLDLVGNCALPPAVSRPTEVQNHTSQNHPVSLPCQAEVQRAIRGKPEAVIHDPRMRLHIA